jgi:uncharacterized protein (TIGR02186 family)
MTVRRVALVCWALMILTPHAAGAAASNGILQLEPPEVAIGLFFSGTDLRVTGSAPAGSRLAVVCAGAETSVVFQEKGKILGVFWMNIGDIAFDHVPVAYQIATTGKLASMARGEVLIQAGVGYDAVGSRAAPASAPEQRRLLPELIKLKEREGLYSVSEGSINLQPADDGTARFSAILHLPARTPEGQYAVRLIDFQADQASILAEKRLQVRFVGAAAAIKSLSATHGVLYGVLSVFIALAAGLATGLIFSRSSQGGH